MRFFNISILKYFLSKMLRNNSFVFLTKYYSGQCPFEQVQMISSWIWHIPGYFLERPGNEIILIIPVRQFKFNSTWNLLKYQLYEWSMSHFRNSLRNRKLHNTYQGWYFRRLKRDLWCFQEWPNLQGHELPKLKSLSVRVGDCPANGHVVWLDVRRQTVQRDLTALMRGR